MSKSEVSRLAAELDTVVNQFKKRPSIVVPTATYGLIP